MFYGKIMCLNLDTGSTDKPHSSQNRCPLGVLYSGKEMGARKGKGKAMNKTKIDWCDSTWNPVTGCLHGCEYCYARGIAKRFGGWNFTPGAARVNVSDDKTYICPGKDYYGEIKETKHGIIADITEPFLNERGKCAYPFGFTPTFHRYHLSDYISKKSRNIFVCSMADLFGDWVPDEWIEAVFDACKKAPQHNYLFLTKNPKRYKELEEKGILRCMSNMWFGFTNTKTGEYGNVFLLPENVKTFVSIEPLLEPLSPYITTDWIIIGAETGRRKDKAIPKREWIEQIVEDCRKYEIPIFMKSSLVDIWGEPLIQEFPKGLDRG